MKIPTIESIILNPPGWPPALDVIWTITLSDTDPVDLITQREVRVTLNPPTPSNPSGSAEGGLTLYLTPLQSTIDLSFTYLPVGYVINTVEVIVVDQGMGNQVVASSPYRILIR